jgi:8-oxo-dGTP pyrophosphatase MutT (NUDIX family)
MLVKNHVENVLSAYLKLFGANKSTEAFQLFFQSYDNVTSRKNLAGHTTGSAIVWHKPSNTILRVMHSKWKCLVFSAGGHVEDGEMPWQASTRELLEETGITATPLFDKIIPVPLIMDAHPIPSSLKKSEPAHWHYDMIYLYEVSEKPDVQADPSEVDEYLWAEIGDVTLQNSPADLKKQLEIYMANRS